MDDEDEPEEGLGPALAARQLLTNALNATTSAISASLAPAPASNQPEIQQETTNSIFTDSVHQYLTDQQQAHTSYLVHQDANSIVDTNGTEKYITYYDDSSSSGVAAAAQNGTSNVIQAAQSTWALLLSALLPYAGPPSEGPKINWPNFMLALVLVMLMLTTAIGNLFVIVAILIERNLRTIGNYLVLSLAIADLLVACLVMPLAGIYEILDSWTLGILLCDIWTSADVFCCTASILHLLAIALDRYWAVTRVDYIRCQRNEKRILFMIFFVWMAACVISLAPIFGWKDAQFESRIINDKECLISQDVGYQIFACCTTFFFPLILTLIFYWKIYQVARKRIRGKLDRRGLARKQLKVVQTTTGPISSTTTATLVSGKWAAKRPVHQQQERHRHQNPSSSTSSTATNAGSSAGPVLACSSSAGARKRNSIELVGQSNNLWAQVETPETNNVSGAAPTSAGKRASLEQHCARTMANCSDCARCLASHWCTAGAATGANEVRAGCALAARRVRAMSALNDERICQLGRQLSASLADCEPPPAAGARQEGVARHKSIGINPAHLENGSDGYLGGVIASQHVDDDDAGAEAEDDDDDEDDDVDEENYDETNNENSCASSTVSVCGAMSMNRDSSGASAGQLISGREHANRAAAQQQPAQHAGRRRRRLSASNNRRDCSAADSGNIRASSRSCNADCCPTCCCDVSQNESNQSDQLPVHNQAGEQQQQADRPLQDGARTRSAGIERGAATALAEHEFRPAVDQTAQRHAAGSVGAEPRAGQQRPGESQARARDAPALRNSLHWLLEFLWRRLKSSRASTETKLAGAGLGACAACQCPLLASARFGLEQHTRTSLGSTTCIVEPETESARGPGLAVAAVSTVNIAMSTTALASTHTVKHPQPAVAVNPMLVQQATLEGVESKRERKAAKTLAIITGVFVMCWLPFFVMAITMPLQQHKPNKYLFAFLLWLGYANSMLNPIIYTIFSPDFRKAFKRLLCAMDKRARPTRSGQSSLRNTRNQINQSPRGKSSAGD